jgi:F-type H+-transporting ATPase subunit delta
MNPQDAVIAGRYAKAFLAAAMDAKKGAAAREELMTFVQTLRTDAALAQALRYPLLPPDEKKKLLAKALGKPSDLFERFFSLLVEKKRLGQIELIAAHFEKLWDEAEGRERFSVTSAVPLGKTEAAALSERLSKARKKPVTLDIGVDDSIMAGLVLKSGDRVWDLSLKGRLNTLAEQLSAKNLN